MPFDLGSSSSSSSDSRQQGGDAAIQLRSQGKITSAAPGAKILDYSGAKITTAPTVTAAKGSTVTINEAAGVSDLASQFAGALADISGQATSALSNVAQSQQGQVSDALQKVSDLSTSQQTGGQSLLIKPLFWIALAVVAVLAGPFLVKAFRKKK